MVESIVAALAGGGTGLLGGIFGRIAGYFEEKQKIAKLKVQNEHELKLFGLQSQERQAERESEERIVATSEATKSLLGSYDHDSSYTNTVLRWVRPILTLLLLLGSFWVYTTIPAELTKDQVATSLVYYTGVAISWWFADRSGSKNTKK